MDNNNLINGASSSADSEDSLNDENVKKLMENLKEFQALVPDIKQELRRISDKLSRFDGCSQELQKAVGHIDLMHKKLIKTNSELDELKKEQEEIRQKHRQDDQTPVTFDVGGHTFTTTIRTITQDGNSRFFNAVIDGLSQVDSTTEKKPIFIDRDGALFEYILKYLRTGALHPKIEDDPSLIEELRLEATYYGYDGLVRKLESLLKNDEKSPPIYLKQRYEPSSPTASSANPFRGKFLRPSIQNYGRGLPDTSTSNNKQRFHPSGSGSSWRTSTVGQSKLKVFVGSKLLTPEYEAKLLEFLKLGSEDQPRSWTLIYQASEHGFDATDFHRQCDGQGPTFSIIQSDYGNIFGGYTAIPWSSSQTRTDQTDPTAFLFTLKNGFDVPPCKFPVKNEFKHQAISQNPTCGPNFGSPMNYGSDLCLKNDFSEKSNVVFFPKSYHDTTGQGGIIFAKRNFACREVEVFTPSVSSS